MNEPETKPTILVVGVGTCERTAIVKAIEAAEAGIIVLPDDLKLSHLDHDVPPFFSGVDIGVGSDTSGMSEIVITSSGLECRPMPMVMIQNLGAEPEATYYNKPKKKKKKRLSRIEKQALYGGK